MKRFAAILLTFCLLLGLLPGVARGAVAKEQEVRVLTKDDYALADAIWDQIDAAETDLYAKRAPENDRVDALIALVEASPYYKEGTLIRNGNFFSWETVDGIPCSYSPSIRKELREAKPLENYDASKTTEILSFEKKGGSPAMEDVYVIQPFYGLDDSFTEQYNDEGAAIAADIGGKCITYRTSDAHIDNIAHAMENGGVVFFDSHGTTDYSNPNNGDDYSTRANTSYFCLSSTTGLTSEDYSVSKGEFGSYYNAAYAGDTVYVNGTAIANHMEKNAPNSLLWIALCLGMATDGLHAPLRAKGVEVAYGYSQSVTFHYDYMWEKSFWSQMLKGETVATSIAYMKEDVGYWDWCHSSAYDTLEEAQATFSAFPIVVSSEDAYPGHGKVDNYQTVKSTWSLFKACEHGSIEYVHAAPPTCTAAGNIAYYRCSDCGICFSDAAGTTQISQSTTLIPATGHSYDDGVMTLAPTCDTEGELLYTCASCGDTYTEAVLALGHSYVEGFCTVCGAEEPDVVPFEIGHSGKYVIAAYVDGEYYAMANVFPEANNKIAGTKITVIDGAVSSAAADPYVVSLQYNSDGTYTIRNHTVYLKYASSTNLTSATAPYYWKIAAGIKGSWRITSTVSTTRGVFFRAGTYMLFGGYSTANFTNSNDYYEVEILPISSTLATGCAHSSTREEVTKEVTCTDDGEITVYCAECGELLGTAPVWATGHNYEEVETIEPTCETAGVMVHQCLVCGDEKTEEIPAIGHDYQGTETTAPTCENAGVMTYTCTNCGHFYTKEIPVTNHSFEDGICTGCGVEKPADWEYALVTDASALEVGDKIIFVSVEADDGIYYAMKAYESGNNVKIAQVDPVDGSITLTADSEVCAYTLGGEAGAWTFFDGANYLYTDATTANRLQAKADLDKYCYWTIGVNGGVATVANVANTTRGVMQYNAASNLFACYSGATQKPIAIYKLVVPIGGTGCAHGNVTSEETVVATCEANGELTWTCADCGESWMEVIPALGHAEEIDAAVAATCTKTGLTEGVHCSVCHVVIVAQTTVPAIGHSYVDGICANCGDSESVQEPTVDENIKIYHTLDLASDISVSFVIPMSMLEGYDSFYLECTLPEYEGNELTGTSTVQINPVVSGNRYYFTLTGITAVRMGDMVDAVLHMTKGTQAYISKTDSYSVATYAYGMLNSTTDTKMLTLCADLLRYGAEAQSFKKYRTDALVDADMTDAQRAYLSDTEVLNFTATDSFLGDLEGPTITWVGKALDLGSKVGMKFVFNAKDYSGNIADLFMKVSYEGSNGETKTVTLTGAEEYNANNGYYSFTFYGLLASELRTVMDVAVYEGEMQLSESLRYSAESYASKTADTTLEPLTRALFAYSDSAKAYFTK